MTTLSILTCVLGSPPELKITADSIQPWLSDNLKWIIKFAEGVDSEFIKKFTGEHVEIYQELDVSLYDALNQSLCVCKSDYYMVLGAGDALLEEGMGVLSKFLTAENFSKPAYHAPLIFNATGAIFKPNPTGLKYSMSCAHPSSLLKTKNSLEINGFNKDYKIAADYDHLSRYAIKFGEGEVLNVPPLVSFRGGGISDVRSLEGYLETLLIRQRVWNTPDIRIFGDVLRTSSTAIADTINQNCP